MSRKQKSQQAPRKSPLFHSSFLRSSFWIHYNSLRYVRMTLRFLLRYFRE